MGTELDLDDCASVSRRAQRELHDLRQALRSACSALKSLGDDYPPVRHWCYDKAEEYELLL